MLWCHGECFDRWKDAFLLVSFEFVGSKAKGRISKRVLQENKSMPNFVKNKYFLPRDTHRCVCVSRGEKYFFFRKLGVLCFLVTPALIVALFPYYRQIINSSDKKYDQLVDLNNPFYTTGYYAFRGFKKRPVA